MTALPFNAAVAGHKPGEMQSEGGKKGGVMFNRDLFEKAVERSGLKKVYIANRIGMGYGNFLKKTAGVVEWKLSEAMELSQVLKLKRAERDAIFFAPEVHEM